MEIIYIYVPWMLMCGNMRSNVRRTSHSFILLSKYSVCAYDELETNNMEAKSD